MKLVIFDLDGTLLNTLADLADGANFAMKHYNFPTHPLDSFRYMVGNGVPKLIERCLPESERSPEMIKEATEIFNGYYNVHYADKTRPYEGIPELLDALKGAGIKTAVASNKPDGFTRSLVKSFFGDSFSIVQGSLPDVPKKPAPDIALRIMKSLGGLAEDTYFAGDSNVDIFTAHNAGVKSIGCLWGFRTREELTEAGAEHLAQKPYDIYDIVNNYTVKE